MKKAAIYARVSSDLQRKEKTIDSQILELKKQVATAGDVLVKEYLDDGYSGARLDRPAMDELRKDLKSKLFDTIYFLNTDRIAREVTYQTIIIAEILKNGKQVIINGKDYVHNPENKFTLTVLGAVAELERAKIIERVGRGKALKLAQGYHTGRGCNLFGYDYIHKTPTTLGPSLKVNEKEAEIVRLVFSEYAKGDVGMHQITRKLEDMGCLTKTGKKLWRVSILRSLLSNHAYIGTMYFNKTTVTKEYANPLQGIKATRTLHAKRDKSEWIGVKVPAIVPKELFEKVQKQLEYNKRKYRNPRVVQMLSSLIRCGHCGSSFYAYRRYYVDKRAKTPKVYQRVAYKCNWKLRRIMHSKNSILKPCASKEITAEVMEAKVLDAIRETMLDPTKLRECMDIFKQKGQTAQQRLEKQLKSIDLKMEKIARSKKRLVDLYASDELERELYVKKSLEYDNEFNSLNGQRADLLKQIPLLHKTEVIDMSISQFCETTRLRFEKCKDFETKREFLREFVERIEYRNEEAEVCGSVPVRLKAYEDMDQSTSLARIEFRIPFPILGTDRFGKGKKKIFEEKRISMVKYNELATSIVKG